ncbi:MAG TPA: ferrochelatase, partial [Streptosporangiaceae bacterium]|nr:ferrochelatase [Streptosporangiaceae bacterium]
MYDALLLVSFGGPEGPDDVIPFLENVTRGRNIPRARLEQVGEHYHRFGGISPINAQCRTLKAALEASLDIPVYWGNRNWAPYLADAVQQMKGD